MINHDKSATKASHISPITATVLGMIKALTSTDTKRERERDGMRLTFVPADLEFEFSWGSQVSLRNIASLHEDQIWPQAVEEIAQKCDLA